MSARFAAVLPRFGLIVVVCLLASAAVTFAAGGGSQPAQTPAPAVPAVPAEVVVPDVRDQAYVFAKGTLEDAGFAWKVVGRVKGHAANVVVSQSPAAGTRLVDTGTPLVTLQLSRNTSYGEKGEPDNASPYPGTSVELARLPAEPDAASTSPSAPAAPAAAPAPKPAAPAPAAKRKQKPAAKKPAKRSPAFTVPGAPAEPLDELPLDDRARRLSTWLDKGPKPTNTNVNHWLYQHQWIVTGARFGWYHGAEALEILVAVDRRVEELWGVGTRSRTLAEAVLAEVRANAAR
jgi:hypothetical protein